ncbi:MAG: lysylphosphatidylglycerol synthase domain-containing protein [Crocinitomicaceae bacterium]
MIKAKKNQLKFFGVLKIIAFLLILAYLFYRLSINDDLTWSSFKITNSFALIFVIALIPLNWFLEFLKWRITTKALTEEVLSADLKHSFYAGMITGLLTPNMIGNFIGRMYYFKRKDRVVVTLLTLISNQAQFLITLLIGLMCFILTPSYEGGLRLDIYSWVPIGLIAGLGLTGYFYFERVLQLFAKTRKIGRRLELVFLRLSRFRAKVLVLSLLRYLVFITQFTLILMAFGVDFEMIIIAKIAQVYLISAMFPTLLFGKLGVRESVGIVILGSLGIPELTVLFSSLSIWLLNLILPSLVALILLKSKKA